MRPRTWVVGGALLSPLTAGALALSGCSDPAATGQGDQGLPGQPALVAAGVSTEGAASGDATTAKELCLPSVAPLEVPLEAPPSAGACAQDDTFDDALSSVAFDRCSLGVRADVALATRAFARPPWLGGALAKPLAFSKSARQFGGALDEALLSKTPVARAITVARSARGPADSICITPSEAGLEATLRANGLVSASDEAAVRAALTAIPPELGRALSPVVLALSEAHGVVASATPRDAAGRTAIQSVVNFMLWSASAPTAAELAAAEKVDVDRMARAAARLAFTVESASLPRFRGASVPNVVLPTTLGDIVLRGPAADVDDESAAPLSNRPVILWLDVGGDDDHRTTAGAASPTQPVSVLVDLDGRDRYGYPETDAGTKTRLAADTKGRLQSGRTASRIPRQGGALLGIALTFDFGGSSDMYRSLAIAQGAGAFGVGVLFDEGGNDDFAAETLAQGAGVAGLGLLIDTCGDDTRRIFARGQGYGALDGVGVLVDGLGDDRYRADPGDRTLGGDLLYPSALSSSDKALLKGNHSAAQGFGEGRRDLSSKALIAAGGFGLLRDGRGHDRYEAGLFAQGGGLEEGAGLLLDAEGDDHYDALGYAQGAGIHRAFGELVDDAGHDRTNETYPIVQTSVGVGHDFGIGLYADLGGNDVVRAPTLSLGSGNANGIGIFVASGGDDQFAAATSASYGASIEGGVTGERKKLPTVGVFVKADGKGVYRIANKVAPYAGTVWHSSQGNKDWLRTIGIDAPTGRARF